MTDFQYLVNLFRNRRRNSFVFKSNGTSTVIYEADDNKSHGEHPNKLVDDAWMEAHKLDERSARRYSASVSAITTRNRENGDCHG